jgi:hypothetical protein
MLGIVRCEQQFKICIQLENKAMLEGILILNKDFPTYPPRFKLTAPINNQYVNPQT